MQGGETIPVDADLVIIPGSKATLADLAFLREQGWDIDLAAHRRRGKPILGICGGYQMLGQHIADPDGIEGPPSEAKGLGLLDVSTVMTGDKTLVEIEGSHLATGAPVKGYEMHIGVTKGDVQPMLDLGGHGDGAVQGLVQGCYLHGLFSSDSFRQAYLAQLNPAVQSALAYDALVEKTLDDLAAHLEANLDLDHFLELARAG